MSGNLDTLKSEIEDFLAREGFIVYHGYARGIDPSQMIYWDTERYEDYHAFLSVAHAVGVSMVVFHRREMTSDMINEALDRLESSGLDHDDYRLTENRLEELRRYEGFTCAIELSFDHQSRVYVYERRAPWFDELTDIMDELEYGESGGEEDDEPPMGGYYSRN